MQLNLKGPPTTDTLSLNLELPENLIQHTNTEYTQFVDQNDETQIMIHQPFLRDSKKENPYFSALESAYITNEAPGKYQYTIPLQQHDESIQYPLMMDVTFHLHQSKQPDSSVKSYANGNQYLGNLLYAGTSPDKGDMVSYIRFEQLNLQHIQCKKIISAQYLAYDLTKQSDQNTIAAYQVASDWGSPSVSWDSQPVHSEKRYPAKIDGNQYTFDITEIVKTWYNGANLENASYQSRLGFVLKGDGAEQCYRVFPSADNVWHSPKLEIVYKE